MFFFSRVVAVERFLWVMGYGLGEKSCWGVRVCVRMKHHVIRVGWIGGYKRMVSEDVCDELLKSLEIDPNGV